SARRAADRRESRARPRPRRPRDVSGWRRPGRRPHPATGRGRARARDRRGALARARPAARRRRARAMNYRHAFHAGNIADVFKHAVLVLLLEHRLQKDTAFCYIDTHAGIGRYDLTSEAAQKTGEFNAGIGRLLAAEPPPSLARYAALVRAAQPAPAALQI